MDTNAFRALGRRAVVFAAPTLLLAACASAPPASRTEALVSTPQLSGTHWNISSIDGRATLARTDLTADFGVDGRVNGDSGCNLYSGSFTQSGSTVTFGELLSTRRACLAEDRARQEDRIMAIMHGATTVKMVGNELRVRGNEGTLTLTNATLSEAATGTRRDVNYDCQGVPLKVEYRGDRVRLSWPDGIDVLERTSPAADSDRVRFESRHSDLLIERDVLWGREGGNPRSCREVRSE
jgi:heat shock protein HslJ